MAVAERPLRIAVVGCGRIGTRRAEVAAAAGDQLGVVVDINVVQAAALGERFGVPYSTHVNDVLSRNDIDAVVVATVNSALAEITEAAIQSGKHVLVEKPFAISEAQARSVAMCAEGSKLTVKVGFNHRYHPGLAKAHQLTADGVIGLPFAVRAAYGHGGRAGYEKEWRGNPALAGGGELRDQGVHLIDLARWFLGDLHVVSGVAATWFWQIGQLEDNAFALLSTDDGRIASLHASWTQWRNLFRFEVIGEKGLLGVEGLGGNYGIETLTLGLREEFGAAPAESKWTFDGPDLSWELEWADFTAAVRTGGRPNGDLADGVASALIVEELYRVASEHHAALRVADDRR